MTHHLKFFLDKDRILALWVSCQLYKLKTVENSNWHFIAQKCTYEKVKKFGQGLPPPHLDKMQKNRKTETFPYIDHNTKYIHFFHIFGYPHKPYTTCFFIRISHCICA